MMGLPRDPTTPNFDWDLPLDDGDVVDSDKVVNRDSYEPMPFSLEEDENENVANNSFFDDSPSPPRDTSTLTKQSSGYREDDIHRGSPAHRDHQQDRVPRLKDDFGRIGRRGSSSSSESAIDSTVCDNSTGSMRKRAGLPAESTSSLSRRKKKPKGMPKRPLSAYNIFFQSKRPKLIEAHGSSEVKPLAFEDLGKIIGKSWRALSSAERDYYEDLASKDSIRYRKEMEMFCSDKRKRDGSMKRSPSYDSSNRRLSLAESRDSEAAAAASATTAYQAQDMYSRQPTPPMDREGGNKASVRAVPHQPSPVSSPASRTHYPPYSGGPQCHPSAGAAPSGPYHSYNGGVGNVTAVPADHQMMQWVFPPPPGVPIYNSAGQQHHIHHPHNMQQHPGGMGATVESLRTGTDSSMCPIPPGMELLLPDRDGRKQKYRVQYACYSMSSQAAQRYVQSLSGGPAPASFPVHHPTNDASPGGLRHSVDERCGLPPPLVSASGGYPMGQSQQMPRSNQGEEIPSSPSGLNSRPPSSRMMPRSYQGSWGM